MTTNRLKGNPWNGSEMNKDRRTFNTKVSKTRGTRSAKKRS